jgi:hypothetical protein
MNHKLTIPMQAPPRALALSAEWVRSPHLKTACPPGRSQKATDARPGRQVHLAQPECVKESRSRTQLMIETALMRRIKASQCGSSLNPELNPLPTEYIPGKSASAPRWPSTINSHLSTSAQNIASPTQATKSDISKNSRNDHAECRFLSLKVAFCRLLSPPVFGQHNANSGRLL